MRVKVRRYRIAKHQFFEGSAITLVAGAKPATSQRFWQLAAECRRRTAGAIFAGVFVDAVPFTPTAFLPALAGAPFFVALGFLRQRDKQLYLQQHSSSKVPKTWELLLKVTS